VEVDYDLMQHVLIQRCTLARLCASVMPLTQIYTVFEDWATAARKAARFQVICSYLYYLTHCLLTEYIDKCVFSYIFANCNNVIMIFNADLRHESKYE